MSKNISQVLESFGFLSKHRSVYLQFSDTSLNSQVFLQRIDGQHYLNQGMTAELICLSTNAHIALKQFIGVQIAVDQVTEIKANCFVAQVLLPKLHRAKVMVL